MTNHRTRAALLLTTAVLLAADPALAAGDGHDHGAAPAARGTASPRFAAVSETFELVGVLNGTQLSLYLDRFADNAPVKGAALELEIGGAKVSAEPRADGEFAAVLAEAPKPGLLPVTATVVAGSETDLLVGEFDLHAAPHDDTAAHRHTWREWGTWIVGAVLLLGLLVWVGRKAMAGRGVRAGGAA